MVCDATEHSTITPGRKIHDAKEVKLSVQYTEVVLDDDHTAIHKKQVKYASYDNDEDEEAGLLSNGEDPAVETTDLVVHIVQDELHTEAEKKSTPPSVWLLAYCFLGIMVSFTLNGLVLEKITNHRVLGELSLTFVFCLFYSAVALGLRSFMKETPSTVPQTKLMLVGLLAFGSTIASMIALRYVTFITRILGKSCKSIPVMLVGLCLGKTYALKKYVSVVVLSFGVAIFLIGTAHEKQARAAQSNEIHKHQAHGQTDLVLGVALLVVSLLFDGATGALEDKFLAQYDIGAFDLMFIVNIWKSVFAAGGMVVAGEVPSFLENVVPSLPNLLLLSATGAFGQAFIFFTISKFGALTTSIIGTCRKVLSIVLSVLFFGHILSWEQFGGLAIAFVGIGLNWIHLDRCRRRATDDKKADSSGDEEATVLLDDELDEDEDEMDVEEELLRSKDHARGLELVNMWHRVHHEAAPIAAVAV